MANEAGQNLRRLMAKQNLSVHQVCQRSGLDRRTVAAVLEGRNKPRPQTLHLLAESLDVSTDEFFLEPAQLLWRQFDRHTNPAVEEVVEAQPSLFQGWTAADFDELNSRHATGGPMTAEGVLDAVRQMNQKRQLHQKLSVLLETSHAELIAGIVDVLYSRIVAGRE